MEFTGWKYLNVVSRKVANGLGIHSEAPVLVSPDIELRIKCFVCDTHFSPLIYRFGEVVAHHFHPEHQVGGIYHFHETPRMVRPGVTALLDCSNCVKHRSYTNVFMTPSVVIKAVFVKCTRCCSEIETIYFRENWDGVMKPYCKRCFDALRDMSGKASNYIAVVSEGILLFSKEESNDRMENP
jgi:hypothetical protein